MKLNKTETVKKDVKWRIDHQCCKDKKRTENQTQRKNWMSDDNVSKEKER